MSEVEKLKKENYRLQSELLQSLTEHPCFVLSRTLEKENEALRDSLYFVSIDPGYSNLSEDTKLIMKQALEGSYE